MKEVCLLKEEKRKEGRRGTSMINKVHCLSCVCVCVCDEGYR